MSLSSMQRLNHTAELNSYAKQAQRVRQQREFDAEEGREVKLFTHEEKEKEWEEISKLEAELGIDGYIPGQSKEPVIIAGTTSYSATTRPTISWVPGLE